MKPAYMIGIGASAGGLEALQGLLNSMNSSSDDAALVIAQHVSPTYKSQLVELLSRQTDLPISDAVDGLEPQAGNVYIIPPNRDVAFSQGRFLLTVPQGGHGPRPSVDRFFVSMAETYQNQAVAVILSGTGSDGSHGARVVREHGGLVVAQAPDTAKYNSMPQSLIEAGLADLIASPAEIGQNLVDWCHRGAVELRDQSAGEYESTTDSLERIMLLLSDRTGTDFSRYKAATIARRLDKRLMSLGIASVDEYVKVLTSRPGEIEELFATILIGVTFFFRDEESFMTLREQLQQLLQRKTRGERVRVWVPGCATGEEAYSIAIMIADILGETFRTTDVQIFATDLDETALATARRGVYSATALENVPEHLRRSYFIARGDEFEIAPQIRSLILFSRHDVTSNPPFLKLDLISCRNLLIYFDQELQQQVLPLFHYALRPSGLLFLGKSETIGGFSDLFETLSSRHKIYLRKSGTNPYAGRLLSFRAKPLSRAYARSAKDRDATVAEMVKETLYHGFEHPYVVVNSSMDVLEVSGEMRDILSIKSGVMNSSLMSLIDSSYEIELRSLLTEAIKKNTAVEGTERRISEDELLRIAIKPVIYSGNQDGLYLVVFERTLVRAGVHYTPPADAADRNPRILELETELAATREHLQNYIEELESSTEELQSLNEELQSTNEELQSSNEELETSNEELQSTNEELQIAYAQLKATSDEAKQHRMQVIESEANLRAVLENTLQAFVLIDRSYRILVHNTKAVELLENLSGLQIESGALIIDYLPGEQIKHFHSAFSRCLNGESVSEVRKVACWDGSTQYQRLQFTPVYQQGAVSGVSFASLDITRQKLIELALADQQQLNELILDSAAVGICLTDREGCFVQVNQGYCSLYGYSEEELIGQRFTMLLPPGIRDYADRLHRRFIDGETEESAGEWDVVRKDGRSRTVHVGAGRLTKGDGSVYKVTTVLDITQQKFAEEERNRLFNVSLDLMAIIRFDGFFLHVNPAWPNTLGYPVERLLRDPFVDFVHPEDRRRTLEFFQQIIEQPELAVQFENRCIAADGTHRWLSWNIAVEEDQRLMYAVARDVTDARRYENLLRDTQSVARVGGWELDLQSDKTSWTDEVYHIYDLPVGKPTDYMTGLQAYESDDQKLIAQAISKAAEFGESSDLEVRFTSNTGRKLWVRVTIKGVVGKGKTEKVMGTLQDITTQKMAELENLRLSLVASRTDNGVIICDSNFRVEWVNQGFEQMTGYPLAAVKSGPLDGVLERLKADAESVQRMRDDLRQLQSMQGELLLEHKDGSHCWVRLDITPVLNDGHELVNWIALVHDVTEQKQFQQQLIVAKERAEEMNHLKSSFLANMSHEVRTPLNGILGMSHVIQRDARQEDIREFARLLEHSGQRLLRTINQVLDLSRIEARQTEMHRDQVELNELCQRICDSIEPTATEKGLKLELQPHAHGLKAFADAYLVENILLNLLNNAIKFTDEGHISVTVRERVAHGMGYSAVEVQDSGIGMSKQYLTRLFEPFSQESTGESRKYEGTGLGLSISREYARLMGGEIEVSSRRGKGSTFRLLLPPSQATATKLVEQK